MSNTDTIAGVLTLISIVIIFEAVFFANFFTYHSGEFFVSNSDCQRCLQLVKRDKTPLTVTTLVTELGYRPQKTRRVLKYLIHHQLITKELNLENGTDYYILSDGELK